MGSGGMGFMGVNYHNWSIPRVSSSRKWTGQGLSSSKQEHFLHQSHHQSAASSYSKSLRMDDIRTQRNFFVLLFLETKKLSFFCMIKCRLFIGLCAR